MSFLVFAIPLGASAGILSFVAKLFSSANAESRDFSLNTSEKIPLLQATLNSDPNPNLGGGDITIVGGMALLPDDNPLGGLAENQKNRPTSDQISIYIVREGDNLSTIAHMFGVSINTIRWSNDISGSTIKPGQTLVILPVSGVRHAVKSGETLSTIAKKYKGDIEEIKSYNNITESTKLAIGDIVIVPDGEVVVSASVQTSRTQAVTSSKEYAGFYLRPVSGPRTQGIHGYNAVDIGASCGSPVVASADGTVIVSRSGGWNGGYGNYIVIQHSNGTQTLYAHNQSNNVSVGERVNQGDVVGYVGATGKATGAHLHFEVRGAKNPF